MTLLFIRVIVIAKQNHSTGRSANGNLGNNPFGLAAIAVPLIVIFIRHLLTRDRDRLKGFNNASEEFRKVFNQALVDIRDDSFLFGTSANDDRIRTHRVAYLNFHYHLHGECRNQYDRIWNQYCRDYENMGRMGILTRVTRVDLEKDIGHLLEFAEYGMLKDMFFFWRRLWFILQLKVFGPDKETKDIVNKFLKLYKGKNPPNLL